jgi:hypothetical protein
MEIGVSIDSTMLRLKGRLAVLPASENLDIPFAKKIVDPDKLLYHENWGEQLERGSAVNLILPVELIVRNSSMAERPAA